MTAGLIIGATALVAASPVAAHGPSRSRAQVLLDELSSPKGIAIGPRSTVIVGQGAFGAPGPLLKVKPTRRPITTTPLTAPLNVVDVAVTPDGARWLIGGDLVLYRQVPGGTPAVVLDIAGYQAGDPDPVNTPGEDPAESNPFGIAALGNNKVLIADAAGNDLIRVDKNGNARTVARWSRQMVSGESAEAVPTSVAIGRDGYAYVGQLVGGPGTPGSAHIWRVNPNAVGATCAVGSRGACKDWKRGFTSIIDLAWGPNRTLYVFEIAKGGWHAFEAGLQAGDAPPAVLLQVRGHRVRELAKGQLSEPGGVAVTRGGTVYVTDGIFTGGRLLKIRT